MIDSDAGDALIADVDIGTITSELVLIRRREKVWQHVWVVETPLDL